MLCIGSPLDMPDIREFVFCRDLLIEPTSPVRLASVSQSSAARAFSFTATRLHAYRDIPKAIKTAPQSAYKAKICIINLLCDAKITAVNPWLTNYANFFLSGGGKRLEGGGRRSRKSTIAQRPKLPRLLDLQKRAKLVF